MFNTSDLLHFAVWPVIILICFVLALSIIFGVLSLFFSKRERDLSNYVRRPYLFDTKSEFELFKMLLELFGDRFFVFPQVHYSHLVEVRKGLSFSERMKYWNSINRKSADFVLCDKNRVIPQLVIELDGSSHDLPQRQERDKFVDDLMNVTSLPILHLKTGNPDKEIIRVEVEKKLHLVA